MSLQEQLDQMHAKVLSDMPDQAALFDADTEELVKQRIGSDVPAVGGKSPDFELPDQLGRRVRSVDLRSKGPLVVSFYRGNW
ncbi:MAG: hypothetical protein ABFS09_00190 [Thermodesulfobacteriota bacterium]